MLSGMPLPLSPKARLADHRDAHVELRCQGCGHFRDMRVEALARLVGWETVLAKHLQRFRCSGCGARRVEIAFGYDHRPRGWLKHF